LLETAEHRRALRMAITFIYECPNTGLKLGFVAGNPSDDDAYEAVTWAPPRAYT